MQYEYVASTDERHFLANVGIEAHWKETLNHANPLSLGTYYIFADSDVFDYLLRAFIPAKINVARGSIFG